MHIISARICVSNMSTYLMMLYTLNPAESHRMMCCDATHDVSRTVSDDRPAALS